MADINFGKFTVLVIEDQAFVRQMVAKVMKTIGFSKVFEAADGAAGIEALRDFRPDLVICDVEMEPVDGLAFLGLLREQSDARLKATPVVFLTNNAESQTVRAAKALGVSAFIVKPPSQGALKDKAAFLLADKA